MKKEKVVETPQAEAPQVEMVKLPLEVVNKVLSYLGSKPYVESADLIVAIKSNAQQG
jgi:hypothetical protein